MINSCNTDTFFTEKMTPSYFGYYIHRYHSKFLRVNVGYLTIMGRIFQRCFPLNHEYFCKLIDRFYAGTDS